jgi:GH24 family phage-related lysozyme (muramidase)/uncharacterized protein (DUF2345 family)
MPIINQSTHSPKANNMDVEGRRTSFDKVYLGFVRDISDNMFMGRVRVWVPELCGPDLDRTYIVCDYVAPIGGSGYGMWAIPQPGAQVIVTFVNGDPNRSVWLGCLYGVDQHASVPNAPANSEGVSIQDRNLTQPAQYSDPRAECQAVPSITVTPPQRPINPADPELAVQQQASGVNLSAETRPTGFSSNNSYLVYGMRTPAGSHLTLSDQQGAAEVRLATFNGMQIILNAQSGTITILGKQAHSRIELTQEGNVNVYGKGNLSLRAQGDINLHADQNVNIQAGEKINMRSGGNTHMESVQAVHIKSNTNMFLTSLGEHHRVSNGNLYDTTAQSYYTHANYGITTSARSGNVTLKAFEGNMYLTVADGTLDQSAKKGVYVHATDGDVHVKAQISMFLNAQDNMNMRADTGQVTITSASNFDMRSNNSEMKLYASGGVSLGEQTTINTGAAQTAISASVANNADTGTGAIAATAATGPTVTEHPVQVVVPAGVGDLVGSATPRVNSVITSVSSYVPAGETTNNRYQSGPGYSNTDTVIADELCSLQYKVGQVEFNQQVPLSVWGYVKGEDPGRPRRFIGEGYEEDGAPRYREEDIPNGIMKPASGYSGKYEGLSETAFNKIKEFETLTGPWPMNLRLQPFHNACARSSSDSANAPPSGTPGWIGYGHKLTTQEQENKSIKIDGSDVPFDNLTDGLFDKLLEQDIKPIVTDVKSAIGGNMITQQQLDALVDFAWNVGVQKFKDSDIVKLINDKKYDRVPNEIIKWSTACDAIRAPLLSRRLYNCYTWSGTQRSDSPVRLAPQMGATAGVKRYNAETVRRAWCYMRRFNRYTDAQIAGLLGNFIVESNLLPLSPGFQMRNGVSLFQGIAQWDFNRRQNFTRAIGLTFEQTTQRPDGLERQLDFVDWELRNTHRGVFVARNGDTVNDPVVAATAVNNFYEISQSGLFERGLRAIDPGLRNDAPLRRGTAQDIFNRFRDTQC